MSNSPNQMLNIVDTDKHRKSIYMLGGVSAIFVLIGILLDIILDNVTGGYFTVLHQTAIEKFEEFRQNKFLGLYHMDLLNIIEQMIMIPAYYALYEVHRNRNNAYSLLAMIIFICGSIIMVSANTALPMYELSHKYFSTTIESQKTLYAAAGEAMLARGAHGSSGIFIGFFIPNLAGLIMSIVMLKGRVFSLINSWLGIIGSILLMVYVVLANLFDCAETLATAIALPGGIMIMSWLFLFSLKFFKLSSHKSS